MKAPTLISIGELLVEFVSHRKDCELQQLSEYSGPYPSGAPAICIDQAARMGAETQIVGALGADNFGNALIERLQSNGVDTSAVVRHENKTTGVAFVSYFEDGNRTFIFHLNNTAADSLSLTEFSLPTEPAVLHVSGSSLGNPLLRTSIEKVARQILDSGGSISCDPNARAELMKDSAARDSLLGMIAKSRYLFPSEVDLEFLFPTSNRNDAIESLLSTGAQTVVMTEGDKGCTIYNGGEKIRLPGYRVDELDPTGAGDCFCGTFLAMIANGSSIKTSGEFANAAGALAVTRRGPMEGNSNRQAIESFMSNATLNQSGAPE